jgi:glutamyl-tRNA(Gln) amidotransferase subunit E
MDYNAIGLTAGIEIHQQLNTGEKLFCHCLTLLRDSAEHSGEFFRYLRVTESEMGEIDRAAQEEMKRERKFQYYTYDTTCLVENDEEPPEPLNDEALSVCLTTARMFGMTPVRQVHIMRKLVIDGSNTSGFQRTALVALNGTIPNGGEIETICLEEEAAQRVRDDIFSLDRLGIPLIEITTSPCMHTPEEVQQVAEYIGMVLRSTGKVKRGIGTIRQDVNISIQGGSRVEIKGVQELDLIAEVVRREVQRQENLLAIREKLILNKASVHDNAQDITDLFISTKSTVLKKAKRIFALSLEGFGGLVGAEIQPDRRLGSELSDYAKKCGVGGIFHTDELPAYGVTADEVLKVRTRMNACDQDCVVIVAAAGETQAKCALHQVIGRARQALSEKPVPEETRKMLETGSSAYMRPLPGAARMYPETDVLPVIIGDERWNSTPVPELLTTKAQRFAQEYAIDLNYATQLALTEKLPLFERALAEGIKPKLAAFTILSTCTELRRNGVAIEKIADEDYLATWHAVETGRAAKEAIPDLFRGLAAGDSFDQVIRKLVPSVSRQELESLIHRIIADRSEFVEQKGIAALGPLMGLVMTEVRGSVDGRIVSELLKKEIGAAIAGKKP